MASLDLDHVGIAVSSLDRGGDVLERLTGASRSEARPAPDGSALISFLGPVELLEPREEGAHLAGFLGDRESRLHHVAFRVRDMDAELRRLRDAGFEVVEPGVRRALDGHRIAFLHPRTTGGVIVELTEGRAPPGEA